MKKSIRINLRNMAISFACLAVVTVFFASCEKEEDPIDTGTEQDADIVAFSFDGIDGTAAIDKTAYTVTAKAKETVDLTAIVAVFTLSKGATAKVGNVTQESKKTDNNFTIPVTYKVTSGDGQVENTWTVTITGGKTDGALADNFKEVGNSFAEQYDFMPKGMFTILAVGGERARFVAKNADNSLVTGDINREESSSRFNTCSNWKIWHEEMYYSVNHQLAGERDNRSDLFYTLSLRTPGGSANTPRALNIETPWGGYAFGRAGDTNPLSFYYNFTSFVNAYNRDQAVFEKNDVLQGIACKKYSYTNPLSISVVTKDEWWILDNGFCLQHHVSWDGKVQPTMSFDLVAAELNTSTYDYVTQKYAKFPDQIVSAVPAVAGMVKATEGVEGANWIAPTGFLPWTAGGFDIMINFRALNWKGYPVHQIYVGFPAGTDMATATEAYKAEIMKIPNMRLLPTSGGSDSLGYGWKYDNNHDGAESYWKYEIQTMGNFLGKPSNPDRIYIQLIDVIFV